MASRRHQTTSHPCVRQPSAAPPPHTRYPLHCDRMLLACMTDAFWICIRVGYAFARINQMSIMPNPIPCTLCCYMRARLTMRIQNLGPFKALFNIVFHPNLGKPTCFPFFSFFFFFSTYRLFTYNHPRKEFGANDNLKVRDDEMNQCCAFVCECWWMCKECKFPSPPAHEPTTWSQNRLQCIKGSVLSKWAFISGFRFSRLVSDAHKNLWRCSWNVDKTTELRKITEFPLSCCYVINKRVCSSRVKPCEDARRRMLRNIGRFIFH